APKTSSPGHSHHSSPAEPHDHALNGADLAEVHAGYSRARSHDFRILTMQRLREWQAFSVT
ncbi:MAG TPA: hypothetical protein VMV92_23575, partial [Streptosporangiaceae bacterium]|nr:hypothetical protein [Streptosporangiaceae bacterium]